MKREMAAALVVVALVGAALSWAAWKVLASGAGGTGPEDPDITQVAEEGPADPEPSTPEGAEVVGPERIEQPEMDADQTGIGPGLPLRDSNGGSVSGRVLDHQFQPVVGAELELFTGPASLMSEPSLRTVTGFSATSGQDGRFLLEDVPPSQEYILVASHAEYSDAFVGPLEVVRQRQTEVGDLRMPPPIRVFGRVHSSGRPIEGATVSLTTQILQAPGREDESSGAPLQLSMTTRVDGTYEFRFVPIQTFDVAAQAPGYGSQTRSSNAIFSAPQDQELDFDLGPAMSIGGQVTDIRGRPLEGAVIDASLAGETFRCEAQASTDASGTFRLESLTAGFYHLNVSCEEYSNQTMPRVEAGTMNVLIQLEPRGSVSGVVVDGRTDAPVPRFTLFVSREMNGRPPVRLPGRHRFDTRDGTFRIDNLDPNRYVIEAWAPGFAPSFSEPLLLERGSHLDQVVVRMNRGGSVSGRVVDGRGQAIADAEVLVLDNGYKWNPITDLMEKMAPTANLRRSARSDDTGRFLVELIVPGTYQIAARHPDLADAAQDDVEVVQDQVTDIGNLVLLMGATVQGHTRDEAGLPLASATVNASSEQSDFAQARSDPNGYYQLKGLLPGTYTISIGEYQSTPPENFLVQLLKAKNSAQTVTLQEGQVLQLDLQLKAVEQRGN